MRLLYFASSPVLTVRTALGLTSCLDSSRSNQRLRLATLRHGRQSCQRCYRAFQALQTHRCVSLKHAFSISNVAQLSDHVLLLYPLAIDLMAREMPVEVRESLRGLLFRIGVVKGLLSPEEDASVASLVIQEEDEKVMES